GLDIDRPLISLFFGEDLWVAEVGFGNVTPAGAVDQEPAETFEVAGQVELYQIPPPKPLERLTGYKLIPVLSPFDFWDRCGSYCPRQMAKGRERKGTALPHALLQQLTSALLSTTGGSGGLNTASRRLVRGGFLALAGKLIPNARISFPFRRAAGDLEEATSCHPRGNKMRNHPSA